MDTGPDSPSTSPGTDVTTYDAKRNVGLAAREIDVPHGSVERDP